MRSALCGIVAREGRSRSPRPRLQRRLSRRDAFVLKGPSPGIAHRRRLTPTAHRDGAFLCARSSRLRTARLPQPRRLSLAGLHYFTCRRAPIPARPPGGPRPRRPGGVMQSVGHRRNRRAARPRGHGVRSVRVLCARPWPTSMRCLTSLEQGAEARFSSSATTGDSSWLF